MGKVYIGVTAVGGHKLWGGWWQEGCVVRWFGGMGERWKIDGRRWEGCGPGMPGPYGGWKGERVLAGRCAGVGWFLAIFVGGGVLDAPRRGQDPSLRCGVRRGGKAVTGSYGKRAGRACPAPTGGSRRGNGTLLRLLPHTQKISLRILCKSRILLL